MFLRTFGPGSIDLLPAAIWDRLLVLRSASGAGKTSLMRLFRSDSLEFINGRDDLRELAEKLRAVGALDDQGPVWLGTLLNLSRNYRGLVDVLPYPEAAVRLFFRLLDARIMMAVMAAALAAQGLEFPADIDELTFEATKDGENSGELSQRLGGSAGRSVLAWAQSVESELLAMLDSLLPVGWTEEDRGHAELYSLRFLTLCNIHVAGRPLRQKPLIMLDDGHSLAKSQRDALLLALGDRSLRVGRWYSERYEALAPEEILGSIGKKGRDYELLELESVARGVPDGERQRFRQGHFERLLTDIANRRAATALKHQAGVDDPFSLFLTDDEETVAEQSVITEAWSTLTERLLTNHGTRYSQWVETASSRTGLGGLVGMKEVEILISRDERRSQRELFDVVLSDAEATERGSSALREAARLQLSQEFGLPFYYGPDAVARLSSQNIEQYLVICGDLFAEMLGRITVDKEPHLTPFRQDRIIRRASEMLWKQIPTLAHHGRDVQALIAGIVDIARIEAKKLNVPYPPGVTGTAMLMAEREQLIDDRFRAENPHAQTLYVALSEAVALNLVSAEVDRSSKNQKVMVLYLNRLLCPRFDLVLGRGGFRERRIGVMASWLAGTTARAVVPELEESLPL